MLDITERDGGLQSVIDAATTADIEHMLCVSVDMKTFPDVLACAEQYANVSASVGQHPNEIAEPTPTVEKLVELAQHPKIIAIGETGLDYFRTTGDDLVQQQQALRIHIQAAKQAVKPLIIHTRQAREDTIRILQEEHANEIGGVMHCFSEDWQMAKQALDLGFYISFSGIVTFKNALELKEVAKQVPLDRMLIETDSPYLAPVPHRGKANEPAYVRYIAQYLAELRDEDFCTIAQATTENFYRLFKLNLT